MATIITRAAKGSPLTNNEMDQNLINLNNDKVETSVYNAEILLKAPIASPTFTGDPKAPTPTAGDNDTSIATTAFVTGAISTAGESYVTKTGSQKSAVMPAGPDAQRDTVPNAGYMRFNTERSTWEGWNGSSWSSIGGGQMYGQSEVKAIFYNNQVIAENINILGGTNGLTAGPITVNNGYTVTVNDGCVWSIV